MLGPHGCQLYLKIAIYMYTEISKRRTIMQDTVSTPLYLYEIEMSL